MKKLFLILVIVFFNFGCSFKENNLSNEPKKIEIGETVRESWTTIYNEMHEDKKEEIEYEVEVEILDINFKNTVKSQSSNMFAYEYPEHEDEKYFVVTYRIKNLSSETISDRQFENDDLVNQYIADGKYKYRFQWVDPDSSVLSQYFYIEPLKEHIIYSIALIPDEVGTKNPDVYFTIGNQQYLIKEQ